MVAGFGNCLNTFATIAILTGQFSCETIQDARTTGLSPFFNIPDVISLNNLTNSFLFSTKEVDFT